MFADKLVEAVRTTCAPLCVGLDPFADRIPALFGDARADARALAKFGEAIIDIAASRAAVVKPQLGLFEPYGPEGVAAARDLCAYARAKGLLTILDAKRGDIGTTAEGVCAGQPRRAPGFDADSVTVAPYMGRDSIEPFLKVAEARGKGVAVLVRTSNPGARDLQDLDAGGAPLWTRTAQMIAPDAARLTGASGWSGLMAVAGATYPEEARALRKTLPNALFLVPGYGAQGAGADDAVAGFVKGAHGREGASSIPRARCSIPRPRNALRPLKMWQDAIIAAMDAASADLRAACTR